MEEQSEPSNISSEEKMEFLEDFLMDIDCLDELDKWSTKPNIFNILSVSSMEIRHSNFLSWLIDPHGNHGLGDYFLKRLLQCAVRSKGSDKSQVSVVNIDSMDLDDVSVYREFENIDVLAVSDLQCFVLVIENKIHSTEHSDQLNRYANKIAKKYPVYEPIFVYLTLDGELPSDERWVSMSYEYVQKLIKSILQNKELSARPRMYLEDYCNILAGELMNDDELKQTCLKIYKNHKQAIDLIIQNLPNDQNTMYDRCKEMLEDYASEGKIIMLTSSRASFRFTTPRIREKVGCVGSDIWISDKDLLVYEIYITLGNYPNISLYIGPGEEKYRKSWYDYLSHTDLYTVKRKLYTGQYTAIFKEYDPDNSIGEKGIEKFMSILSKNLENLDKVNEIVDGGPDLPQ